MPTVASVTDTLIKTKLFASVLCKWNVVASQEHCHPRDGLLPFDGKSLYPIYSYTLGKGLNTELLIIQNGTRKSPNQEPP